MKRVSTKMAAQLRKEALLKKRMIEKAGGKNGIATCAMCGKYGYVQKHEIKPRSLGGDSLDEENCVLLEPLPCHANEKLPWMKHHTRSDFKYAGPV